MNSEFLPEADEELLEAARYYESEAPGVCLAFIAEVHRAISLVVAHPRSAKRGRGSSRKKVLPHLPYSLLYSI
jgi:plasmid stabilization system protein ParE